MCRQAKGYLTIRIRSGLNSNFEVIYYKIEIEAVLATIDPCDHMTYDSFDYCIQIVNIELTMNRKALGVPLLRLEYFLTEFSNKDKNEILKISLRIYSNQINFLLINLPNSLIH